MVCSTGVQQLRDGVLARRKEFNGSESGKKVRKISPDRNEGGLFILHI